MIQFTKEQRFIVTGASSGIGEAVALRLNELGASVIAIARNAERLLGMKAKSKHPENIYIEIKDLAENIEELPSFVKELKDKYGKFQGLANCAGVGTLMPLQALNLEFIQEMFKVNYMSGIMMVKGFADRRVNNGKGSSIVSIASIAADIAEKGQSIYAGSKAALVASMKSIAKELSVQGICVNTVSPSMIQTPMLGDGSSDYYQDMLKKYTFGFGKASDVANMVVFLLSQETQWITGQNYIIDCGTY